MVFLHLELNTSHPSAKSFILDLMFHSKKIISSLKIQNNLLLMVCFSAFSELYRSQIQLEGMTTRSGIKTWKSRCAVVQHTMDGWNIYIYRINPVSGQLRSTPLMQQWGPTRGLKGWDDNDLEITARPHMDSRPLLPDQHSVSCCR